MNTKINITSSAAEKSLEIAKNFIDKLITPAVEETGLLLRDQVAKWRFNNQIKILVNAKEKCKRLNINPQKISPKLLTPLLEFSSLEDDENLQDKWSNLLVNLVDSQQNIQNHVFPYLLSQISLQEYVVLEKVFEKKLIRVRKAKKELTTFLQNEYIEHSELLNRKNQLKDEIRKAQHRNLQVIENPSYNFEYKGYWNLENELNSIENSIKALERKRISLEKKINEFEYIETTDLKDYEISNIIRLGLSREVQNSYGYIENESVKVIKAREHYEEDYVDISGIGVIVERDVTEYELTELAEKFLKACRENTTHNNS